MAQLQPELQPNKIKINVQNGNGAGAGGRRVGAGQDTRKEGDLEDRGTNSG